MSTAYKKTRHENGNIALVICFNNATKTSILCLCPTKGRSQGHTGQLIIQMVFHAVKNERMIYLIWDTADLK